MRYQLIYGSAFLLILLCVSVDAKGACKVEGKRFSLGKSVPSKDPCETCTCEIGESGKPEVVCYMMACAMFCEGEVVDDGTCCGRCPSDDDQKEEKCDSYQCPKLRCSKRYQIKTDDMCCPQCKCRKRGKRYMPGPVGDRCDGCSCNGVTGRIECEPPTCPVAPVECMDAVKGDDCCYYCPNGKTCALSGKLKPVIKYGEYKRVKDKICACAGEPWYPYAFCASSNINKRDFKGMMEFMAPMMDL